SMKPCSPRRDMSNTCRISGAMRMCRKVSCVKCVICDSRRSNSAKFSPPQRLQANHADIMWSIQHLDCSPEFTQRNFALSTYLANRSCATFTASHGPAVAHKSLGQLGRLGQALRVFMLILKGEFQCTLATQCAHLKKGPLQIASATSSPRFTIS